MKFTKNDEKLMQLVKRRKVSYQRIKMYDIVFNELYQLFEKTPTQFIKESRAEQQPFLDNNGNPKILELDERKINKYQFLYSNYLDTTGNSERTKKTKLITFRCLFNEYNIELPKPLNFNVIHERTRTRDLPTWNDVKKSLKYCINPRDKAIVTLLATSGMREGDAVSFTIQDFLNATEIYHDGTLENLLLLNPYEIVPCYDFKPAKTSNRGNVCITYNTGECTQHIFQYLKERIKNNISVKPKTPLFHSYLNKGFLKSNAIIKIFQRINDKLNTGMDKNGYYGKFRAHNLRKLFSTTCRRNITNIVVKNDKYTELDFISIFTGHTPPNMNNSEVYDAIDDIDGPNNPLRQTYEALIPYLIIDKNKQKTKTENDSLETEIMKIRESVDILLTNKKQLILKS